jgi:hypothetical protein
LSTDWIAASRVTLNGITEVFRTSNVSQSLLDRVADRVKDLPAIHDANSSKRTSSELGKRHRPRHSCHTEKTTNPQCAPDRLLSRVRSLLFAAPDQSKQLRLDDVLLTGLMVFGLIHRCRGLFRSQTILVCGRACKLSSRADVLPGGPLRLSTLPAALRDAADRPPWPPWLCGSW